MRAAAEELQDLGFNQLESEVYVLLLSSPPMTAYGVARQLAKATANVYKAVEVLARKGAVVIEEGDNRLCRAVPFPEFMRRAERDYRDTLRTAAATLAALGAPPPDERVYRMDSAPQVFEAAREMLETRARKIAIVDAFPSALERISASIRKAADRGVRVLVEAYQPVRIPGAQVVSARFASAAPDQWRSEQLNVVIDGREHLIALLSSDLASVHQAVWSNSLYLSCIHHAGRACEHTLVRMIEAQDRGAAPDAILRLLKEHRFFLSDEVPGQKELLRRHVEPPAKPPASRRKR